jgi:putative chitinase
MYAIDYNKISASLFKGGISDTAKRNIEIFLTNDTVNESYSKQQLAYLLATVYHETGIVRNKKLYRDMAPVEEMGKGKDRKYGIPINGKVYYGRGHVQLTWLANYEKAGKFLGIDLVNKPELALDEKISASIIINGMLYGWFTGKTIKSYLGKPSYYIDSRRIINGTDKAALIANYAIAFEAAII